MNIQNPMTDFGDLPGRPWTAADESRLRQLRNAGYTVEQLCAELGRTKSAVLTRGRRMGLKFPSPCPRPCAPRKPVEVNEADQALDRMALKTLRAQALSLGLLDLKPLSCRWPVGVNYKGDHRFCVNAQQPGSSYCPDHHKIAYTGKRVFAVAAE